jgi:ABC-2 type transport system permease protein
VSNPVWLVARREITTRWAMKSFRITTVVLLLIVVGFPFLMKIIGGDSGSTVAFTPSAAAVQQPFVSVAGAVGQTVTVSTVESAAGEQQLRDGSLDALVTGTPDALQVVVRKDLAPGLADAFAVLARQVALADQIDSLGGNPGTVAAAVDSATFGVRSLEPQSEFQTQRLVFGIIVGILVYMALMIYGQTVAQGVVEEKSSRVVELLLTTIRPWQLMLGKVTGIGLLGLGQLLVIAIAGVASGIATDTLTFPTNLAVGLTVSAVLWFLLGYLVYALMFAGLGALVSRQEDVGGVVAPALILIILPYVLGISVLPADPDSELMRWMSIVPFFAPTLMPMRVAMGVAPTWEVVLASALTVLLIVVLVWLAGRIYGNAVLRMGSRVRFRDALRAAG